MVLLLLLLAVLLLLFISSSCEMELVKNGCQPTCGDVTIPYPFGTTLKCSYNESFVITCNHSLARPYFKNSNVPIINISIEEGEIRAESQVSRSCYGNSQFIDVFTITNSIFPLSSRNKFITVGCNSGGFMRGYNGSSYYATGCVTRCNDSSSVKNGTCSGNGCCETKIRDEGVFDFSTTVGRLTYFSDNDRYNPCAIAFVAEEESYKFSSLDLHDLTNPQNFPVVLSWSVGKNLNCKDAKTNPNNYACVSKNSDCLDSNLTAGYICNCSKGFEGNPYLPDGCQDIDECKTLSSPCGEDKCNNFDGSFTCNCGFGSKWNGTRCNSKALTAAEIHYIALGSCIGLLTLLLGASWIYWGLKKRALIKLKHKFFKENGGLLLQQQLSSRGGSGTCSETAKVFTSDELIKATDNYHETRILGQGGFGTVYKGVLSDNKVVAIKRSKISDMSQIEMFVNEVVVLSQINHRNVVKLLGCCLETQVPLLVYEFIANGTLFDHLHDRTQHEPLSWEMRLKIAAEAAGAIAYLHSSASIPIIHRDIKTTNILLDENYTTKVSDFGASRLVPLDQTQLTTLVQGTLGYLDPEYLHTSQLTEKSDVYSFGVVLAELVTGEKALSFARAERNRSLATYFVMCMKEDRLVEIIDKNLVAEENNATFEQIEVVANVAKACLRVKGEERPTMKEVANELEGLCKRKKGHPSEESESMVMESSSSVDPHGDGGVIASGSRGSTGTFDSINVENLKPYSDGR